MSAVLLQGTSEGVDEKLSYVCVGGVLVGLPHPRRCDRACGNHYYVS